MTPETVLKIGIGILSITASFAVIAGIVLRLGKRKLHHQLTKEYGERRQ